MHVRIDHAGKSESALAVINSRRVRAEVRRNARELLAADRDIGLARIRGQMGITIIWVEHIMGVLMRVVDRVVVLDHGEVIFSGAPKAAQDNARVIEVYLGTDADA